MGAVVHLVLGQWDALVRDFAQMDILKPSTDPFELAVDLRQEFLRGAPEGSTMPVPETLTFKSLTGVLFRLALKYKFRLPPYYTLVVRSLATLEGVALRADPSFKILQAAFPVVLERLIFDNRRGPRELLRELLFGPEGIRVDKAIMLGKLWVGERAPRLLGAGAGETIEEARAASGSGASTSAPGALAMAAAQREARVRLEGRPTIACGCRMGRRSTWPLPSSLPYSNNCWTAW